MTLHTLLALLGVVFESAVIFFLVHRKIWRTLPAFTIYLVWALLSDLVTLYVQHHSTSSVAFIRYYLIELSLDSLFQFPVLVELAWSVLRPVRTSLPRGTPLLLAILVAVAGLIIWPLAGKTIQPNALPDGMVIIHLQSTFAILRVVCFLLMASFSQLLSIGWRDRELQVATGFGFYSIVSLIVTVLHSHQADQTDLAQTYYWLDFATSASYLGTLFYWVLSFSTKEQKRKEFSPQMQHLLLIMSGGARAGRIALSDLPSEHMRKKD